METVKPNAPVQKVAKPKGELKPGHNVGGIKNAIWVIVCCLALAILLFLFFFGNPGHFFKGDELDAYKATATGLGKMSMAFAPEGTQGHPHNLAGTIFMGGVIVPILQTLFLTVIVLSVERFIALSGAKGTGSVTVFVENIKKCLAKNDIAGAQDLCKKQRGSVAAVVSAALTRYAEMDANTVLSKEQKIATIQKEVEEATAIEMPSLQQNLPIVAALTTLGTLVGLLGTVIGMIKSFQALANSGAPDSTALSTGISEALVNTAFGIATAAFAVISYNYYTNKIDTLTYAIDEVGFSIVQSFAATH